ncbi:MAG: hypothetical protein WBW04_06760 [Nitrolancea sp.]
MNASQPHHDRATLRDGTVLRQIIGEHREAKTVDVQPSSVYEAITRQMVVDLAGDIHSVRTRIDSLFSVVVGAILLDLLLRLAGLS